MKKLLGSKTLGLGHHKQQAAQPVFKYRTYISNCSNILIKHLKYIYEKCILKMWLFLLVCLLKINIVCSKQNKQKKTIMSPLTKN